MFLFRSAIRPLPHCNLPIEPINVAFDNNLLNGQRRGFAAVAIASVVGNKCSLQPSKVQSNQNQRARSFSSMQYRNLTVPMSSYPARRSLCTHEITKNLTLYSDKPRNLDRDPKTLRLKEPIDGPLVIIFSWMLAKRSHLAKYVKIYTDLGFDAISVEITPWQLLWPLKGSQLIAADFLKFLENNQSYNPYVIHGFSVGGYMCGEVMLQMSRDMNKYQPLLDKVVAQIWDSAADITDIPVGFPKAMFPKNPTLENALRRYVRYHMKTFHEQATNHYIRSSQMFHSTLIKAPALMYVSKSDPIGMESSNWSVKEDWERGGVKVTWKCWDHSPHVLHYQKYPEEYKEYLFAHLQENALDKIPQKSRAKL